MNLNIGCGEHYAQGWVNTDVTENDQVRPDVICDVLDMSVFDDETFDKVYMGHCLEHLPKDQVGTALREVMRVLKPGGFFCCVGPDIDLASDMFLHGRGNVTEALLHTIRHGEDRWAGDVHHWTPTNASVAEYLFQEKFIEVAVVHPIENLQSMGHWPVVAYPAWQHCVLGRKPL